MDKAFVQLLLCFTYIRKKLFLQKNCFYNKKKSNPLNIIDSFEFDFYIINSQMMTIS